MITRAERSFFHTSLKPRVGRRVLPRGFTRTPHKARGSTMRPIPADRTLERGCAAPYPGGRSLDGTPAGEQHAPQHAWEDPLMTRLRSATRLSASLAVLAVVGAGCAQDPASPGVRPAGA